MVVWKYGAGYLVTSANPGVDYIFYEDKYVLVRELMKRSSPDDCLTKLFFGGQSNMDDNYRVQIMESKLSWKYMDISTFYGRRTQTTYPMRILTLESKNIRSASFVH